VLIFSQLELGLARIGYGGVSVVSVSPTHDHTACSLDSEWAGIWSETSTRGVSVGSAPPKATLRSIVHGGIGSIEERLARLAMEWNGMEWEGGGGHPNPTPPTRSLAPSPCSDVVHFNPLANAKKK
jgi:hypothetical protein